jgi:hypothetical protein
MIRACTLASAMRPAIAVLKCNGWADSGKFCQGQANQIVVLTEGTGSPAAKPAQHSRP